MPFVLPFVLVYAVLFIYPTCQLIAASFTDASLTLPGQWIGLDNYARLFGDKRFFTSVINTGFFVLLTVLPSTLLGLVAAMMVNRLKGFLQAAVLALFFLPYVLPAAVVANIWWGLFDTSGVLRYPTELLTGRPHRSSRSSHGSCLLWRQSRCGPPFDSTPSSFLRGSRAFLPKSTRRQASTMPAGGANSASITWPLIWPATALVLTIQLILQLKIFDVVYLLSPGPNANVVLVQYIYTMAFQRNESGYGSTIALGLFVLVMIISVLQYQALRVRGVR